MKKLWLTTSFLWLFIILSACNLPVATEQPQSPPAAPPPTVTPQAAESVFGPETFNLTLPEGWGVSGPEAISGPNGSYDIYQLGVDPGVSGGPGLSHVIVADAALWTPEALVLMQCSTCPAPAFEPITIDGQPALRAVVGGGGVPITITWHFIEHKGKLIAFAIHDPETLEPLDEVIASIHLQ